MMRLTGGKAKDGTHGSPWCDPLAALPRYVLSLQTIDKLLKLPSVLFRNKAKKTKALPPGVSQGRTSLDPAKGMTCSGVVIYDKAITLGEKKMPF